MNEEEDLKFNDAESMIHIPSYEGAPSLHFHMQQIHPFPPASHDSQWGSNPNQERDLEMHDKTHNWWGEVASNVRLCLNNILN